MDIEFYQTVLKKAGVIFSQGLSALEIIELEAKYHFRFPPDLKNFLMCSLPVSNGFVNWRESSEEKIEKALIWPYEGICFDIVHNSFWLEAWGPKPSSFEEACKIAKMQIEASPTLIPIIGHRYMPDRPIESGNPVFSVYQTDIIYYGANLAEFLENEFLYYFNRSQFSTRGVVKHIEFWSQFAEE